MLQDAMKLYVESFDGITSYKEDKPHVVISITSPNYHFPTLPDNPNRLDVLRLSFRDTELCCELDKQFTKKEAVQIIDFVLKHRRNIKAIWINCEAGISRSPAVAAALEKWFNHSDSQWFKNYVPNRRVYAILLSEIIRLGD